MTREQKSVLKKSILMLQKLSKNKKFLSALKKQGLTIDPKAINFLKRLVNA